MVYMLLYEHLSKKFSYVSTVLFYRQRHVESGRKTVGRIITNKFAFRFFVIIHSLRIKMQEKSPRKYQKFSSAFAHLYNSFSTIFDDMSR